MHTKVEQNAKQFGVKPRGCLACEKPQKTAPFAVAFATARGITPNNSELEKDIPGKCPLFRVIRSYSVLEAVALSMVRMMSSAQFSHI